MIRRLVLAAALALVVAPQASAHAVPIAVAPANGSVLGSSPAVVAVTFDSGVRVGTRIAAVDASGRTVLAGRPRATGRTLVIPLRPALPRGDYTVRWSVVSDDGHEEEGLIAFAVGLGSPKPVASLSLHGLLTWQRIVMRALLFLGALGAGGVAAFTLLVLRPLGLEQDLLRREAGLLFGFLLAGFCGSDALLHSAGVAGTRFEHAMIAAAIASGAGCVAAALTPLLPHLRHLARAAAGTLLLCPTVAGHALDAGQPTLLAPLSDALHLGAAAVWVGGLAALATVSRTLPQAARAPIVRRFGAVALPAVGVIAVAGVTRALTELSSPGQLWSTPYGRVILVKSGLLVAALGVAWIGRSAVGNPLRPTRLLAAELAILAGIVVAVGVLTDVRPGRQPGTIRVTPSNVVARPPPPPAGAFVDARQAGRYAVGLAYLDGRATVTVLGPDGGAVDVPVEADGRQGTRCGTGCTAFPLQGRTLGLTVAGEAISFTLPERLRPADAELRRLTRSFLSLHSVTFREQLSSAPGNLFVTVYREQAPDRLAYRIVSSTQPGVAGSQAVSIGEHRWQRSAGGRWVASTQSPLALPKPFWSTRSRNAWFLTKDELTFFDPALPAWFRIRFDPATGRTLELHMTAAAHFMVHDYSAFDSSSPVSAPPSR